MATPAPSFAQAAAKLPRCLRRATDDAATLDDLLMASLAEIDHYDADDDDHDIKTPAQRRAAQRFVNWLESFAS